MTKWFDSAAFAVSFVLAAYEAVKKERRNMYQGWFTGGFCVYRGINVICGFKTPHAVR